ncbi:Na+/H+ antiporter subunit E [Xanthobacter variabilis]|uniref:Na+/H+ antiporter subunit E n=1 Tax=Xanthobacter variabilis TaxID=3119932 RepID=UPI0037263392
MSFIRNPVEGETARATPAQRAVRSLWFFLAWVALGRVGIADLMAGAMVSVLCGELSLRLLPPAARGTDPRALAVFVLHFLGRSVAAGVDVGLRVLRPSLPIAPGVLAADCGLAPGLARQAFAATASLQPGTLPLGEEPDALLFHVLDMDGPVLEELETDLTVFLNVLGPGVAPEQEEPRG